MHYLNFNARVVFFYVVILNISASAFPIYWTGGSGDGLWSTPGNWATGSLPHDTATVQFNASSSSNCTLDIDVHLDTLQLTPEYTGRFVMKKKLHIRGIFEFSTVECISATMSDTLVFTGNGTQNITGKPGFVYPVIVKEGTGTLAVISTGFRSHGFVLKNGILHNNAAFNDTVGDFICTGGQLSLNFGSIKISGVANFEGIQDFSDNSGVIYLSSVVSQNLIPNPNVIFPEIDARSYQLHINGDRLRTSKLTVDSGMVFLDAAICADSLNVNYEGKLAFDTNSNHKDTIGMIDGTGTLVFGNNPLHISRDANFALFDTIYGTAVIELDPVVNSVFRSKDNFVFDRIQKTGTSTITVENSSLRTRYLSVYGGTFDWGTSYNDSIYDTLFLKNALMKLGSNAVMFRSLIDSNSIIDFNYGFLERFGNDGVIDLGTAQSFSYIYQGLSFRGAAGATTKITSPLNCQMPPVQVNDSGLIEVAGNFNGSSIMMNAGNWNWGTNFTHAVRGISVYGGRMIFGNTVVIMDSGNIDIGNAAEILKGTATLQLNAKTAYQMIISQSDSVLPNILKTDTSELMINSQLKCHSFTQTAGKTIFSGFGITADSSIIFENVDSLMNMGGITFEAGKSITFSGSEEKPLYCNPESGWFVNAAESLQAHNVIFKNCSAIGIAGKAYGLSVDSGGNSNWTFNPDDYPPDNDLILHLTALDTGKIRISWNPSVSDSNDAMRVGIRYSNTLMPESMDDENTVLLEYFPLTDTCDTVENLNAHTTYYFAAAVSDSSGNWSDFTESSSMSVRTKAIAPQVIDPPAIIHSRELTLSWITPPGLTTGDALFIHINDVGDSSSRIFAQYSIETPSTTILLPPEEGLYRYILSTSHDSAGFYYPEDAYIDTVQFVIDPPVLQMVSDTVYTATPAVSWTVPEGFTASDTIFIYTDTVNGASSWVLNGWYTGDTNSHIFTFSNTGTYKIMISTNWDKTGKINQDNIAIDTIHILSPDNKAPKLSIDISDSIVIKSMPPEITGTAYDTTSGVVSLSILINKKRDTTYWNGTFWQKDIFWIPLQNQRMWNYSTFAINCDEGMHCIKIAATDSVGNTGYDTTFLFIDTSAPLITKLFDNEDTAGSWNGLISGEAIDSFSMIKQISVSVKNDSGMYYDGSGWSTQEYFHVCDGTLNWSRQIDVTHLNSGNYSVSIVATDTIGNSTASPVIKTFRYYTSFDDTTIDNSAPQMEIHTDTTVSEGWVLIRQLYASDPDNDSFVFRLKNQKDGMSIDKNVFRWTPRNSDVGIDTVVVECTDIWKAASFDTFTVTVNNVPESPVASYEGAYDVFEDSGYSGTVTVIDPDIFDTITMSIVKKPAWITISGNKLTGVPTNQDVGVHQVELTFTDRDSLSDTLSFKINVINTNDEPVIITGTMPDTLVEKIKYSFEIKITDDDDGDSIKVKNSLSYSWIKINTLKSTGKGNEWVASVTFSPAQKDTGTHEIKFEIADRFGGKTYYLKKMTITDADDPPEKPLLVRKIAVGAAQYAVSAIDDRDKLLIFSVKMKSLNNDSMIYADSSVCLLYQFYPLSDGKYQFSAFAVDGSGLKSENAVDTVIIAGSSVHIFKDTNWEMAAVPSKSLNVEKFKNSSYLLHWDESGTEKQVYSFYKKKDEIFLIEPSEAYWRKGISGDTIKLSPSDFIDEPVIVKLHKTESGWNQISSPFPYPVSWSCKSDILWKWNSSTNDYEEVQNVLEPWCGYWVCVDSATEVPLSPLPVFSTGSLAKLRKPHYLNKNNWMLQVSLRATGGNDIDNKFGLNRNASDQLDDLDRPEPPGIDGRPVLYFKHDDMKNSSRNEFASDIRKSWKSVNIFEFALQGTQEIKTGTLNFSGLENGTGLYVFTKIGDSIFQVEQSDSYSVHLSKDISYQTVFVTDNPGFLNSFPLHFRMGNPYPNPFCPTTRINYTLPYRWGNDGRINLNPYKVSIEIFDIMGRKLKTIVYRKMVPGNYTMMWDGKMQNGRIAASGKYFCVLKADNIRYNRNLTLMK
ncbi:MAG: hypothetical protein JW915_05865 [Chitinispirillaceae bacterium]|nr:hypothetical protein [Chitinispirillaceae bacterium]